MSKIFSNTSQVRTDSVSKLMQALAYRDNRFIATLINPTPGGTKKDPNVTDPNKHKWVNERLNSARGILTAGISESATTATVENKYVTIIPNATSLLLDDEIMTITNATLNGDIWTLTLTRGQFGTTAAAHDAGTLAKFERAWGEGEDAKDYDNDKGEFSENVCQIFRFDVALTGSAQATKTYTNENDIEKQIVQKIPMLFQQIEGACFHANAPFANNNMRKMAGMPYYLANNMKKNNEGNKFSLATLADDVEELAFNGVDPSRLLLLAGRGVMSSINELKANIVQETMKIRGLDFNLDSIVVPGKNTVKIAPLSTAIAPNEYYLYDKDSVQLKFFRALEKADLGKTGDSDKKMVVTEATIECHNWEQGGALRRINIA